MKEDATIGDAACQALRILGRAATIEEIFSVITREELYQFNTPRPEHVLRTTIERHLDVTNRTDQSSEIRFHMNEDQTVSLAPAEDVSSRQSRPRGPKRVMRASDKEPLIQELMSDRVGVFREIWRLLLFAAQVGVKAKRRDSLKSTDAGKGIDQSTFGNSSSWPGILYLIALAEMEDSKVLASTSTGDDIRVELFQEYANGGLAIMSDFFECRTIDLDGLIAFIETHSGSQEGIGEVDLDLTI